MIRTRLASLAVPLLTLLAIACSGAEEPSSDIGRLDTTPVDVSGDLSGSDISVIGRDATDEPDVACGALGCACATPESCDDGLCIRGVDGQSFCTVSCDGLCPVSGYACRSVLDGEGAPQQVCLPRAELCVPCGDGQRCGDFATECVTHLDGEFCAAPCGRNGTCQFGSECVEVDGQDVCLPRGGACQECVDPDEDGFGLGLGCLGADCDEESAQRNAGASEVCDGVDDDCDGAVDEGFDLQSDTSNCGGCGVSCNLPYAEESCESGACAIAACEGDWRDCNGDPTDGCEVNVWAADRCGTCALPAVAPGTACGVCAQGLWTCNADGGTDCVGDGGVETLNACGGCTEFGNVLGAPCGPCGLDGLVCAGLERLTCSGSTLGSECGGCRTLDGAVGDPCGTCSRGSLQCSGLDALVCEGDPGPSALNACRGCGTLDGLPGDPCESCPAIEKVCSGLNAVACPDYECCPGATREVTCGSCGTTTEVCGADARWRPSDTCDQPTCCPGASRTRACSECGDQTSYCGPSGEWGGWSSCVLPTCCPGAEDVAACEGCGFTSRVCLPDETWGEWSACNEPACCSGEVQRQACNDCGEQVRTCNAANTWGGWTTCAGDSAGDCGTGECGVTGYCE